MIPISFFNLSNLEGNLHMGRRWEYLLYTDLQSPHSRFKLPNCHANCFPLQEYKKIFKISNQKEEEKALKNTNDHNVKFTFLFKGSRHKIIKL